MARSSAIFALVFMAQACLLPVPAERLPDQGQTNLAHTTQAKENMQVACLNTPLTPGTFSLGEVLPKTQNGMVKQVAGTLLKSTTLTINDVQLDMKPANSIFALAHRAKGSYAQWSHFDKDDALDASLTLVQLEALPCVGAILTVENRASEKTSLKSGTSMCFAPFGVQPFAIVQDEFAIFGDASQPSAFILNLPGQHFGPQRDGLMLKAFGEGVCAILSEDQELSEHGEIGDLGSILLTLCVAPYDKAVQVGKGEFLYDARVMHFLKADVRDSLLNYNQGYQANVFLSGHNAYDKYEVYLNEAREAIAHIRMDGAGNFMGGIIMPHAKEGDVLRFKSRTSTFDLPIIKSCSSPFLRYARHDS